MDGQDEEVSTSSSSNSKRSYRVSRHYNPSATSKHELIQARRLQAMRYSVQEKQRQVSNLLFGNDHTNTNNGRFVFSILDNADDSESEEDVSISGSSSCISFQSSSSTRGGGSRLKQMQQQPAAPLGAFGRASGDEHGTPGTSSPTTTTRSSSSRQSQDSSTWRDSSIPDLESGGVEFYTDSEGQDAAADVHSTYTRTSLTWRPRK
jgi:hypothetical protein